MHFWVDMDNAPHVHVLRPIIAELERRGHSVEITARDYGQTLPLLKLYGLKARCVGRHAGKNPIRKDVAFVTRSLSLLAFAAGKRFDAAFSHGSRSLVPVARFLGVPVISMGDYEYASSPSFMRRWISTILAPDVIPIKAVAGAGIPHRYGYPGIKEDLYIHDFEPDPSFLHELNINPDRILVLVRPPATMAHYAVRQSETFFYHTLDYLCGLSEVQILLLPRTEEQRKEL
jgi:predicted glycosyltransferase